MICSNRDFGLTGIEVGSSIYVHKEVSRGLHPEIQRFDAVASSMKMIEVSRSDPIWVNLGPGASNTDRTTLATLPTWIV